jgi:hypothetical protein
MTRADRREAVAGIIARTEELLVAAKALPLDADACAFEDEFGAFEDAIGALVAEVEELSEASIQAAFGEEE